MQLMFIKYLFFSVFSSLPGYARHQQSSQEFKNLLEDLPANVNVAVYKCTRVIMIGNEN